MSEQAGVELAPTSNGEANADLITVPTTGALQRLEAEVAALDKAFHWAKAMSATTMVPEHFQRSHKPRGCTEPLGDTATYNLAAAVMYGMEIGLSAMQSAQNVFVVHGKPAVYARTMAGQVRAAGYVIEPVEESDTACVWKGLRDGTWAFSEWTMARAEQAGYTSNERYQKNPQEMLRAKCIAEICRIKYQDVLMGMAYSVEELQLQDVTVQRVVKQGVRGTAALRQIAESADDDPHDDNGNRVTPAEEPPAAPPGATNPQLVEIRKLYKAKGMTGQAILDDLVQVLQREQPLTSLHELSHEDAKDVITILNNNGPDIPEKGPEESD